MKLLRAAGCAAIAGVVLLLLLAVGQPLFTDDLWWHLALGERYAALGPWLAADPLLFTAAGPPAPAAWLADWLLHALESLVGFQGLRVFHVSLVLGLLALVFGCLRRAGGYSNAAAAVGVGVFVALGAYRLIQLRPHLFTILGALLLYRLVIEPRLPSWRQVAGAVWLQAVWVNLHAGFLLGPVLLAAAMTGVGVQLAWERASRHATRARATRMAVALGLGLLATLANPAGVMPHLLYFVAGGETPGLSGVADEWSRVQLTALPLANLPPSPLAWLIVWGLLLATPVAVACALRDWSRGAGHTTRAAEAGAEAEPGCDLAQLALAIVSLLGMLLAVRFLWLAVFPLLLIVAVVARRERWHRVARPVTALLACALLPAFVWLGAWPMISRAVTAERYSAPYPAAKWNAHAAWWLADTGLKGNLFTHYSLGNFFGYWLSPGLRLFVNGSLNVPTRALADYAAILRRQPAEGDSTFLATLARYDVDLFLGAGLPRLSQGALEYTAAHLERAPGWIPVFRNLRDAIYLRADERNQENLRRVERYYAGAGVPFDVTHGFDPVRAIQEAPEWARARGLMPSDYAAARGLMTGRRGLEPQRAALARMASIHAVLGDYHRAIELDRRNLQLGTNVSAARRTLWCQLHLHEFEAARAAAQALREMRSPGDDFSEALAAAAERIAAEADPVVIDGWIATLPLLTDAQAVQLPGLFEEPIPRSANQRRARSTQ